MVNLKNVVLLFMRQSPVFRGVWLFLWVSIAQPIFAQENLSVDFGWVIQGNFLGVNAVYHAFSYMPESIEEGMTPELRAIEMNRVSQSGIHFARSFYRADWAMGEESWTEPDWQSVKMQALYAWLADMKRLNVQVGLNMGWWFARDVIWNRDQHLPSYPDDLNKYVAWVSESLHQIIELRGFTNVKYIFMFTEPAGVYGDIPHGKKPWEYYKEVLTATQRRLLADHRRHLIKIVGPNTSRGPRWVEASARELNDVIDVYASHDYNYDTYQDWYDLAIRIRDAAKLSGKPFWVDEYGIQNLNRRLSPEYGNIIAQANAAFINAGAQSSQIWILNDQYYPYPLKHISNGDSFLDGKHSWGLYPWLPESKKVRPSWDAFSLLSLHMGGEGTKVFFTKGTENVHLAATKLPDGNSSFLVVNGGASPTDIRIDLSEVLKGELYRYSYDPALYLSSQVGEAPAVRRPLAPVVFQKGEIQEISDILQGKEVVVYSTIPPRSAAVVQVPPSMIHSLKEEGNVAYLKEAYVADGNSTWPVKNVTDGKRLSFWQSKKLLENRTVQLIVDLAKTFSLQRVELYPRSDKKMFVGAGFPEDFTIDISIDKKNWQTVTTQHGYKRPSATVQSFAFPEQLARYVRLNVTKSSELRGGKHGSVQLGEIKAYTHYRPRKYRIWSTK